jgi:hypothetical protein
MSTMDARSRAFVVHLTPHRIRIKIPQQQRNYAYFAALKLELAGCPEIISVHVNALAASIVIYCGKGFKIASVRHCFMGLELALPASGSLGSPRARQIASAQRIGNHSNGSICLVSLAVKFAIAIATKRLEALIREFIVEAVVRVLLPRLYRAPMPQLGAPQPLLVAAAG